MRMMKCPKCGAENSVRREGCFNCGGLLQVLAAPVPQPSQPEHAPGAHAAAASQDDVVWYGIGFAAAAWVIWGPIGIVSSTLILPAVAIGNAAGLFGQRALEQAFPERNTTYLRIILGVISALLAWEMVVSFRIERLLAGGP
jgi:hypothetical protein